MFWPSVMKRSCCSFGFLLTFQVDGQLCRIFMGSARVSAASMARAEKVGQVISRILAAFRFTHAKYPLCLLSATIYIVFGIQW